MKELDIKEFENELENSLIIDFRDKEIFELNFIPGSLNIKPEKGSINELKKLIENDRKLLLVCLEENQKDCFSQLKENGFSNIKGTLKGGFDTWKNSGKTSDMIISIMPDEFATDFFFLNSHEEIIDIREEDIFEKNSISKANNIPLENLASEIHELSTKTTYYIIGNDSFDSVLAACYLKSKGFQLVKPIIDGFNEIQDALKYHTDIAPEPVHHHHHHHEHEHNHEHNHKHDDDCGCGHEH